MLRPASLLVLILFAASPEEARGQQWSVDVSTGRIVYDPIAAASGTGNLVGTLRYDAPRDAWVYGSGAVPLRDADPVWGAAGAGGRLLLPRSDFRRVTAGIDLGADGFLFRDAVTTQTGNGGTLDALPFVRLAAGPASVEARGGWRGYALSQGGIVARRGVLETGARATYEAAVVRAQADLRWVHASEGNYPFVGGSLAYGGSRGQIWGHAGRWLAATLEEVTWGAGAGLTLGQRATLWATLRQEASDPLYWNAARRTWSIGLTHRLGRAPAVIQPAARTAGGDILIRLPVSEAPDGAVWIAGDFNNWQPAPMRQDGDDWVFRPPAAPGVYNYAFRGADGEWFVPPSVAGRRPDGMGGHVAVLVVP